MIVTIRAQSDGQLVRLTQDGFDLMCPEPGEPTQVYHFDDLTNAALLADLAADPRRFVLLGTKLLRLGVEVTVAPPSVAYQDYQAALELAKGLKQYNGLNNPTNAQSVAAIKANNRLTLVLGRLLLREIAGE